MIRFLFFLLIVSLFVSCTATKKNFIASVGEQEEKIYVSNSDVVTLQSFEAYGNAGGIHNVFVREGDPGAKYSVLRHPKHIENSYRAAKYLEKKKLPAMRGRVVRNNGVLRVVCANRKKLVFTDKQRGTSKGKAYVFVHYYAVAKQFLIFEQWYEGGSFLLINEVTGRIVTIPDEPFFSPDRKWFVSFQYAGMFEPYVVIFKKKGHDYVVHWRAEWAYPFAGWKNNRTIELDTSSGKEFLVNVRGKWTLKKNY